MRMFEKFSLNKKIMILYLPVISLGIILCFSLLSGTVKKRAMIQFCETELDFVKNISDKTEYINENIINISNKYLMTDEIQSFFRKWDKGSEYDKLQRYQHLNTMVSETANIFLNILYKTTLIGMDGAAYYSNSDLFTKEENKCRLKEYNTLMDHESFKTMWVDAVSKGEKVIIPLIRYVKDTNTGQTVGMLIFDFEESVFRKLYSEYIDEGENIFLIMENGIVFSDASSEWLGKDIDDLKWFHTMKGYKEGYFYSKEEQSLFVFTKSKNTKWYVVKEISDEQLMLPYKNILEYMLFIVIAILVGCMFASVCISRYITQPIQNLAKEIRQKCRSKNMIELMEYDREPWGHDEIAYLNFEYKEMNKRLDEMIKKIYREQEQKRVYEIEALQRQINPHFLYNTLLSIRYINAMGEYDKIDKILTALIQILSSYFKDTEREHTVEKEFDFLKNYIYIQKIRYGDNFEAEFQCQPEAKKCFIPKMVLQPLVENAIFHGVSSYEKGGLIQVIVEKEGERLNIIISDNGVGFNVLEINERGRGSHGIGVNNVKNRLKLLYGDMFELNICSKVGEGTKICLKIPAREAAKDENYDCR